MNTKEMIEVMQAFIDGKEIECMQYDGSWETVDSPTWDWFNCKYRIKGVKSYREYRSPEEFMNACKEHGPFLKRNTNNNSYDTYVMPISIRGHWVDINKAVDSDNNQETSITFHSMLYGYKWQDGTACGITME